MRDFRIRVPSLGPRLFTKIGSELPIKRTKIRPTEMIQRRLVIGDKKIYNENSQMYSRMVQINT